MKPSQPNAKTSRRLTRRQFASSILKSWDFGVALVGAAIGALAVGLSAPIADEGQTILIAIAGIGAAFLAIAMAAVTVFATLIDDDYREILERADSSGQKSIRGALLPYRIVISVSGAAALAAIVACVIWPWAPGWLQTAAFSVALGLGSWCIAGTIQVSDLSLRHAEWRAEQARAKGKAQRVREYIESAQQQREPGE